MREIKFRAWFPIGHWVTEEYNQMIEDYTSQQLFESFGFWEEDIVYMQYTGLKDKNGKEIYEGDIYFDKRWGVYIAIEYGENENFTEYGDRYVHIGFELEENYKFEDIEIIGNIHQNPELCVK